MKSFVFCHFWDQVTPQQFRLLSYCLADVVETEGDLAAISNTSTDHVRNSLLAHK